MDYIPSALAESCLQALYVCLCGGLALASAWGLWLMIRPDSARRFAAGADRWVSTERAFDRLNQPLSTHRFFYRHHRAAGLLICLGSLYALLRWRFAYDRDQATETLFIAWVRAGMDWMLVAAEWLFVGFNLLFFVAGLVVMLRPSLLKVPEAWANRWVEVPADQILDRKFDPLQRALEAKPKSLGLAISTVCSGLLAYLLYLG